MHIVIVDAQHRAQMSGEAGPSSSYQDDDQWEQLPASALNDEDAGWETVPTKRKPSRKAAAPSADGAAAKTYSAFDPSTWGPPKEAPKSRSRKQPADKGAKAAPMPAPAADDEADGEAGGGAAGKARKRKGKDPRAELEECCVRLLQNSSRDGHMTVETLGQAVADAMGGASWNKKWKPLVGSLKEFAGSSRALAVAHVNGECRVYLAAVHAELARAQKKRDRAAANGSKAAGGGGGAAGAGKRVLRFIGTALRLAGGLALLAASLRGGACALDLPVLDCALPCLNGTAAGVGGGECVATGRTAELARWCARRWAPALREGAMTLRRWGAPDIVGASWEPLTPLAEALAAAAADGHACEPPKPSVLRAVAGVEIVLALWLLMCAPRPLPRPTLRARRRLTAHARPHRRRRSSWRAPRWPAAFIALAHGALWAASALDSEGAALEPYALARVSLALWVFVVG